MPLCLYTIIHHYIYILHYITLYMPYSISYTGVQEALARIASETFIITSAQQLVNSMLGMYTYIVYTFIVYMCTGNICVSHVFYIPYNSISYIHYCIYTCTTIHIYLTLIPYTYTPNRSARAACSAVSGHEVRDHPPQQTHSQRRYGMYVYVCMLITSAISPSSLLGGSVLCAVCVI